MGHLEHPLQELVDEYQRPAVPPPQLMATAQNFRNGIAAPFTMPNREFFLDERRFWESMTTGGALTMNRTFSRMGKGMSNEFDTLIDGYDSILEASPKEKGRPQILDITSLQQATEPLISWTQHALGVMAASRLLRDLSVTPLRTFSATDLKQPEVDPFYDPDFAVNRQFRIHLNDTHMGQLGLRVLYIGEQRWYSNSDVFVQAERPARLSDAAVQSVPPAFDTYQHTTLSPVLKLGAWAAGRRGRQI